MEEGFRYGEHPYNHAPYQLTPYQRRQERLREQERMVNPTVPEEVWGDLYAERRKTYPYGGRRIRHDRLPPLRRYGSRVPYQEDFGIKWRDAQRHEYLERSWQRHHEGEPLEEGEDVGEATFEYTVLPPELTPMELREQDEIQMMELDIDEL